MAFMRWGVIFVVGLVVFLFIGGPDYESHRVYKTIWNTGHLVLFSGLALLLLNYSQLKKQLWLIQFVVISLFSLIIGYTIEVVQLYVGRSYEMMDVLYDLLGGNAGFLYFILKQTHRSVASRISLFLLMLILIGFVLLPVFYTLIDEYRMRKEFPVLSEFESKLEIGRWDSEFARLSIDDLYFRFGFYAMRVEFSPGEYPDITLQNFPRDWQGFEAILFSIYNPDQKNIEIELKIYDRIHIANDYEYSDRFNRELVIKPGWNDYEISLEELESAPASRRMDLSKIKSFSLFLHNLETPQVIYIDSLRLM